MDEKDIMSTLSLWANELGEEEIKNVYKNIINMESGNGSITDIK